MSSVRDVVMSIHKEGHMTHRQSIHGSAGLIASAPGAKSQYPTGFLTPARDIDRIDPGAGPQTILSAHPLNVRMKENHEKK